MAGRFDKTSLPRPQFLVREECRERWGHYTCDGRRDISVIQKEFPDCDFSEVEHDEDAFYSKSREESDHCKERAIQFLDWLNKRPEKCIAVVTHSSFLRHLFSQFGGDQALGDKDEMQRLTGNCELRSIVLCSHGIKDGRMLKKMVKHNNMVESGLDDSDFDTADKMI
jgi:broad specificity phosphatase PhoE